MLPLSTSRVPTFSGSRVARQTAVRKPLLGRALRRSLTKTDGRSHTSLQIEVPSIITVHASGAAKACGDGAVVLSTAPAVVGQSSPSTEATCSSWATGGPTPVSQGANGRTHPCLPTSRVPRCSSRVSQGWPTSLTRCHRAKALEGRTVADYGPHRASFYNWHRTNISD